MTDPTEGTRRFLVNSINNAPGTREALVAEYGEGNVFDTNELTAAFDVIGFAAPFVVVTRKSDGVKGSLLFQSRPRFYFNFQAEEER